MEVYSKKAPLSRIKESKHLRVLDYARRSEATMCTVRLRSCRYGNHPLGMKDLAHKPFRDLAAVEYGNYVYTAFINHDTGKKECWRFLKDAYHHKIDISVAGRKFCPTCNLATRILLDDGSKKLRCPACIQTTLEENRTNAIFKITDT
ncbi:hypothetical protein [Vibrio phage BONAISHI]|nr:hypothetical protein [Vibrio phage BONAISHI]